ncbi:MAG: flavin reductase [Balneolaceae bacterium]|nr:flavin reductase [Balneolaceae bacterium]
MIKIDIDENLWSRCYTVHSLIIIGSKEENGDYNLAPKHMAMPLGFNNYFAFMGTPRKSTYKNIEREKVFTVSYPRSSQIVLSSLAASAREEDATKPIVETLPTVEAQEIEGQFLEDSYFQLECKLSEMMGKFGEWEIIVGKVLTAYVSEDMIRKDGDDSDGNKLIYNSPLLAYLHPDRFSVIKESNKFPFPKDFKR